MTFASFAAPPNTSPATGPLQASGTVSATGASSLTDLEDKLAEKAKEQGAKGFVVNAAGGKNQMYGTATIYK
ncbi:Multiple stress resistance protein BhsA precursor [compost metagenome]